MATKRSRDKAGSELRLGDWRVEPLLHELRGPGGHTRVEARSIDVLLVLAERAGEVVLRDELLSTVWGDAFVEEQVLTHAIWDLRRALGDDPKNPSFIETLPKRGYRLIAPVSWSERQDESRRALDRPGTGDGAHGDWTSRSRSASTELEELRGSECGERGGVDERPSAPSSMDRVESFDVARAVSRIGVVLSMAVVAWLSSAPDGATFETRSFAPPPGGAFVLESGRPGAARVSPDGAWLAFAARDEAGTSHLWLQSTSDTERRFRLPDTKDAESLFWSSDSRDVFFGDRRSLRRVSIDGGPARDLCAAQAVRGGAVNLDGVVLVSLGSGRPLHRADATGYGCDPVGVLDHAAGETSQRYPRFLADGRRYAFLSVRDGVADNVVMIGSLDGGRPRELMRNPSHVDLTSGHVWYVQRGNLLARPFDRTTLRFVDEPVRVVEGVGEIGPQGLFSVSESGVLAYHAPDAAEKRVHIWRDRTGRELATLGSPAPYIYVRLSPDGSRVASTAYGEHGFFDVWLHEEGLRDFGRLSFEREGVGWSAFSPDGSWLAVSVLDERSSLELVSLEGEGETIVLWEGASEEVTRLVPTDWSPTGDVLLAQAWSRTGEHGIQSDVWVVPLDRSRRAYPLLQEPFNESNARFSSDGRWIVYTSDELSRPHVFATSYQRPGRKWQLSDEHGGQMAVWKGDEVYYLNEQSKILSVPIDTSTGTIVRRRPVELFQIRPGRRAGNLFAVGPRGQRFLSLETQEDATPSSLQVVTGWPRLLAKKGL